MSSLPAVNSIAPAFVLADSGGAEVRFGKSAAAGAPTLLVFFKHDCPTCDLVAPLAERLHAALGAAGLRVLGISQDETTSATEAFCARHGLTFPILRDTELAVSEAYAFDAVPALVLADAEARVLHAFEGFGRDDYLTLSRLAAQACGVPAPGLERAGETLPASRPGCGSRVHDPDVARRLAVRRGAARLAARRVRIPSLDDPHEFLFEQGLTDGLPVVPPTEARVLRMLEGTRRRPDQVVARIPPNLAPATVEKVAINAVMAGCRPEYLPVVIAAVEAVCTSEFNMHGVLATTYFTAPILIVNGPIRRRIGLNCEGNVFGQGFRANASIGRAVNLLVRNVGGGKPQEVDMSALGNPAKFTCCIAENEEVSPWEPLHVERGFAAGQSTVTAFAGEAPRGIMDQTSRTARSLATSFGLCLEAVAHPKFHGYGEVVLVVCPEHVDTLKRDGYTKTDLRERIQEVTRRPLSECVPDDECAEGLPLGALPKTLRGPDGAPKPELLGMPLPKFGAAENILIVVAGGPAGKFSAVCGGWAGALGSTAVTRVIDEVKAW